MRPTKVCISNPGTGLRSVYSSSFSESGQLIVKETGVDDFQAYINSFKDSTDMNQIIAKLSLGDVSALTARPGFYGDFTKMPKTYAEMLNTMQKSSDAFYSLPKDIRDKFNNDVNVFLATAGSPEWIEKINPAYGKSVEKTVESVIDNES